MSQPIVIITGANGFVGSYLTEYFAAKGWQVRALVRDPASQPPRQHTAYYAYDLHADPDDELFQGADYLVHTAYIPDNAAHPDAYTTNVEGAKRLLSKAHAHNLKKNVFLSSMSAHGDAVSGYAKQKSAIEALWQSPRDVSIRAGLIVGNGGLIKQIVQFMSTKHVAPLIDGGDQPLQVIAVYDLARCIETIFTQDISGTLTLGTPEVYTYREFYQIVSDKLGIRLMTVSVPFWLPLYAIRLINALRLPFNITEDNLQGLRKLRAWDTIGDLKKLDIRLDTLDQILGKPELQKALRTN